jgi:hypothetical protein
MYKYKYIIEWTDKETGEVGYGDFKFFDNEKEFAEKVANDWMNIRYPQYSHKVVLITKEIQKKIA